MARLTSPPRPDLRWRRTLDDHVIAVGWSPDGATLAAASVAGPVALFDVSSGAIKHPLPGHGFGTTAVSWYSGREAARHGGQNGKAQLWDVARAQELAALDGGAAWVEHVAPGLLARARPARRWW
jgi:WD40 repeat protein